MWFNVFKKNINSGFVNSVFGRLNNTRNMVANNSTKIYVVQYVVLGPRLKVINLNILPESSRNELKYALKIAFTFLSLILKFQVPDINILLGIQKRRPFSMVLGPRMWSLVRVSGKQHEKNVKML